MTETFCGYLNRDDVLVAYLYDDIEPERRSRFEAHLASCARCRDEVAALRGVRARLAQWSPPAFAPAPNQQSRAANPWWRSVPAWAQVAAAMLLLGIGAGLANIELRYAPDGVTVRTGWSKPASPAPAAPWREDLAALEARLRTGLVAVQARSAASSPSDADIVRRVRALVEESERRQQRELALRVADAMRDLETQRRADLVKIDRSLGVIQNNTGVEVLKQRELLNYLVRASQNR